MSMQKPWAGFRFLILVPLRDPLPVSSAQKASINSKHFRNRIKKTSISYPNHIKSTIF